MPAAVTNRPATSAKGAATKGSVVVQRGHLTQALARIMPIAASRHLLPVLTGVRLTLVDGLLKLTVSDLDVTATCAVPIGTASKDFDAVVPARRLQRLLQAAAGDIQLDIRPGSPPSVEVTWGRTTATFECFDPKEWPDDVEVKGDRIHLSADDLDLLRRAAVFCSRDDARPILTGLGFGPDGVSGSDSYRLFNTTLAAKLPKRTFILPARVLRFLPPKVLGEQEALLTVGEREATLACGDIHVIGRLIDGDFPTLEKILNMVKSPTKLTFQRSELAAAVRAAKAVFEQAEPVKFDLADAEKTGAAKLVLTSDQNRIESEVSVAVSGTPIPSIAFNPAYLAEVLQVSSASEVTLGICDALKPMIIEEDTWRLLLMPVRSK